MNQKIRVLHIQETIGSGGVERRRLSLAKLLDNKDYELKIVCTQFKGDIKNQIESYNVEVISIGQFKGVFDFKNHIKVQRIISDYKPHIIHGAVFEGVTLAALNGFIKRVPIIIIEETSDPQNRSWRGNLLMKIFALLSTAVIGVSPGVMEYLNGSLKIAKSKTHLINNGVLSPRAVDSGELDVYREKFGFLKEDIIIGSVGRMLSDQHKRFSDLIKAFAIVQKNHVNTKLLLVGEGPEVSNYKLLVDELNITNNVVFTGYQSDVAIYYRLMDIFSLVSAYEAFGLVLAEAMHCKLPVVATNVGGMKYIVRDNVSGYLAEKYDIRQIAEKLDKLVSSPDLRLILGVNGYKIASTEYNEELYVKTVVKLYEILLRKYIVLR